MGVLGPEHAAFRYGGDEFVVMLRGLNRPAAIALTGALRRALKETAFLSAQDLANSHDRQLRPGHLP